MPWSWKKNIGKFQFMSDFTHCSSLDAIHISTGGEEDLPQKFSSLVDKIIDWKVRKLVSALSQAEKGLGLKLFTLTLFVNAFPTVSHEAGLSLVAERWCSLAGQVFTCGFWEALESSGGNKKETFYQTPSKTSLHRKAVETGACQGALRWSDLRFIPDLTGKALVEAEPVSNQVDSIQVQTAKPEHRD